MGGVGRRGPMGVLKHSDRFLIELTARLLVQSRTLPVCSPALSAQLRHCLGELGLCPAGRARFCVPATVPNPFDE